MSKKMLSVILIVVILIAGGVFAFYGGIREIFSPNVKEFNPTFSSSLQHMTIYKTKADYYNFVSVELSDDKSKISSFPDVSDVYYNGELAYPTRLTQGYLLDNRGVWKDSAFLNITYEEYSELEQTPSTEELFNMIVDDNPFLEIYDCGNRVFDAEIEADEINQIIESGQLSKCKVVL